MGWFRAVTMTLVFHCIFSFMARAESGGEGTDSNESQILRNVERIAKLLRKNAPESETEICHCRAVAEFCNQWILWDDSSGALERRVSRGLKDHCVVEPSYAKALPKDLFFDAYSLRNVCAVNTYVRSHEKLCLNVYESEKCLLAIETIVSERPLDKPIVRKLSPLIDSVHQCWKVKQISEVQALEEKNAILIDGKGIVKPAKSKIAEKPEQDAKKRTPSSE